MPLYQYKGLNLKGKVVSGAQEADSQRALKEALKRDGVFLTEAIEKTGNKPPKAAAKTAAKAGSIALHAAAAGASVAVGNLPAAGRLFAFGVLRRVPLASIGTMTRLLSVLLSAQIPLVESLGALIEQVDNPRLKEVLIEVKDRVNEGSGFADALKSSGVFSDLYINMVRSGEASGTLDVVLVRLADFTESQLKVRGKIVGALMYPALMTVVGGGILFLLMTTVVPQLRQVFDDMDARLPWYTELLIWASDFLSSWWWLLLVLGVGGIYGFTRYVKTPEGRLVYDRALLKMPIFGSVIQLFAISRFARTLSTLRASNVEMLKALEISRSVMANEVLAQVIDKARDGVREGDSLSAPLRRSGYFPPLVSHMVAIGEKAGRLEEMLENVANAYDSQADARVQKVTSLLEPIMIVFMGGSVGFVVFAILMPIMQMNKLF
jgi:general secretion pathway protein F